MSREEVKNKVFEIFQNFFGNSVELTESSSQKTVKAWDSVAQMQLLGAVEKEFAVKIKMKQILKIEKLGDFINAVCELKEI